MADYFSRDPLKNRLGIDDPDVFRAAESRIVSEKIADILDEPVPDIFDFGLLKQIHKTLFEDIYDFAGKTRAVDIAKPGSPVPFAHFRYIESEAERIFVALREGGYLRGRDTEAFVHAIAELSADLNALHPFREGNGRSIRLFLALLATSAGYLLDYSAVPAVELIAADREAFEGDMTRLVAVYQQAISVS